MTASTDSGRAAPAGSAQHWQVVAPQPDRLGESPFWHSHEQRLYWVDIPAMQLHRCDTVGGETESWAMPSEPGCIAPAASGGLVIALRDGIYRARAWGGALVLIARFNHDPRTTRFNDGKADPLGRLWAGTMYEPRDARKAELYSIDCRPGNGRQGQPVIECKARDAITANGLAWSPDHKTVYWTDTPSHSIQAWDWDADSSEMSHHRIFRQFPEKPAGWQPGDAGYGGRPDGASVDSQGNYWCAMYEGGRVLQISPAGELLQDIPVPVMCPTMPCFGGSDLNTLLVTTARDRRPNQELERFPGSGHVLARRVDVAGLPVNFFVD